MRTKFVLLLLTVMLSTPLFAQKQNVSHRDMTPQQMAEKMTTRMKTKLTLTPEQEKKIYDINLEFAKKQAELRKENSEKMKSQSDLRKKQQEKINDILTPEQKAKLEEMKATKMERKKSPHKREMKNRE